MKKQIILLVAVALWAMVTGSPYTPSGSATTMTRAVQTGAQYFYNPPNNPRPEAGAAHFMGYVPNEVTVKFNEAALRRFRFAESLAAVTGVAEIDQVNAALQVVEMKRQFFSANLAGWYRIRFAVNQDIFAALASYARLPHVLTAEPIGVHRLYAQPNDPQYANQYHINKIQAPAAWDTESGNSQVIVAVLDSGVRYYHDDLGTTAGVEDNVFSPTGNMWRNPNETNDGADNDGNGRVDDEIGWDFVASAGTFCSDGDCSGEDNNPKDHNGHGTHVAGIVGSLTNNGIHGAGVAGGGFGTGDGVRIMALRIGWSAFFTGLVDMGYAARALDYAAAKGARIANGSWGSSDSGGLRDALTNYLNGDRLFFKAAGNDNATADDFVINFNDERVVVVGSTDSADVKSDFSSFGPAVDLAAPGTSIVSTYSNGFGGTDETRSLSGTSMASPCAAGVAALVWSNESGLTATQVKQRLKDTADNINDTRLGAGRVNASRAVSGGAPPTPPAAPSNLTATAASASQINLSWSDNANNESGFRIERCQGSGCTSFSQIAEVGAGVTSYSNTGLAASTTYVYRVLAYNSGGASGYSNTASATTQAAPSPPAAPSNLTATAASASQINLSWTDNANNEDGFRIERCQGSGCTNFSQIAEVGANVTSYSNTGLSASTTYVYRVRSYNAGGNSNYSNTASATTQAAGSVPAAPSNLSASSASNSQINLSWTDNANNESGFRIERCQGFGCSNFAQIAEVGAGVTSYSNTGLNRITFYSYRVRAFNSAGNSGYSNTANASTPFAAVRR
jgi:subtilisin family serine protease